MGQSSYSNVALQKRTITHLKKINRAHPRDVIGKNISESVPEYLDITGKLNEVIVMIRNNFTTICRSMTTVT